MQARNFFGWVVAAVFVTMGFEYANAQILAGPRVGVNLSQLKYSDEPTDLDLQSNFNLQIGMGFEFGIGDKFAVQPEVTYLGKGNRTKTIVGGIKATTTYSYIDFGALAKLKFGEAVGFYIGAGPYVGYAISGQTKVGDATPVKVDFKTVNYKRPEVGATGALGAFFGDEFQFFVDARYQMGLTDLNDNDGNTDKFYNRGIGISAGVMVPLN